MSLIQNWHLLSHQSDEFIQLFSKFKLLIITWEEFIQASLIPGIELACKFSTTQIAIFFASQLQYTWIYNILAVDKSLRQTSMESAHECIQFCRAYCLCNSEVSLSNSLLNQLEEESICHIALWLMVSKTYDHTSLSSDRAVINKWINSIMNNTS